jgi:hypothetical protein
MHENNMIDVAPIVEIAEALTFHINTQKLIE